MASPSRGQRTRRIALITGANSGVGYGLAQRLITSCRLVLACRNQKKAEGARQRLLRENGGSGDVELILLDLSSVKSVVSACREFRRRFERLDLLFCNAGILLCDGISVAGALYTFFSNPVRFFTDSGDALVQPVGVVGADGLAAVFAANVFGHYLMVTLLENQLAASTHGGRVIWTSSFTAKREHFSMDDYQHLKGTRSYESSKYAMDLLSVGIAQRLISRGVASFTTSPGTLHTNILSVLGPLDWIMSPMFYMARTFGIPQMTIDARTAVEAHVFCANMPLPLLSPKLKYHSEVTRLGKPYVNTVEIDFEEGEPAMFEAVLQQAASEVLASDGQIIESEVLVSNGLTREPESLR